MSLVPELFDLAAFERLVTPAPPAIETPLGRFALSGVLLPAASQTHAARLRAGRVDLFIWDDAVARVELRVSTPELELPDGMNVSDVRAAVWRVRARRPLSKVEFSCELVDDSGLEPTPDTGQGLEAVAWEGNGVHLSLGTPDAEALQHYARDGAPFPASWSAAWQDTDPSTIPLVQYRPRGLRVALPPLAEDELAQTHFVVAWAPETESDATWYAVDQSPRVLLQDRTSAV